MSGYLAASSGRSLLPDLLALIAHHDDGAQFFAFGQEPHRLADRAALDHYAAREAYDCTRCDNQESRIDRILSLIAARDEGRLDIVVTDLWLDNRSFAGTPQVALGIPLREILRQGRSVGVLGIRAPFSGTVYSIPHAPDYGAAQERPLFILMVGDPDRIQALRAALLQSGSPGLAPDRVQFSLFSAAQPDAWMRPHLRLGGGGGVAQDEMLGPGVLPGVPKYTIMLAEAAERSGRIEAALDAGEGLPTGLVWQGPLRGRAQAWRLADPDALAAGRCEPATWENFGTVGGVWRPTGDGRQATFTLDSRIGGRLVAPGTYYVLAELGTTGLTTPNPAAQWMHDWSVSTNDAARFAATRPTVFKALELAAFAGIMEQELAGAIRGGRTTRRFEMILKVNR